MRARAQLVVLLALVAVGGWAAWRAGRRLREFRQSEAVCGAVEQRDWRAALAASPAELAPTVAGLRAADCRCVALEATGRHAECVASLERLLADPRSGDWLPRPALVLAVATARRTRGDIAGAAELARRGDLRYRVDASLLELDALLRLQVEGVAQTLREMEPLLASAGSSAHLARALLAARAVEIDQPRRALTLLGPEPTDPEDRDRWYYLRALALAATGEPRAVLALVEQWKREGGNPADADAVYALALDSTQQHDPLGRPQLALLRDAIAGGDQMRNRERLRDLYVRYVMTLAGNGFIAEATRAYDEGTARVGPLAHLDRADVLRARPRQPGVSTISNVEGTLELRIDAPREGDRLLVSPEPSLPEDTSYESLAVPPSGVVRVQRANDSWPVRWVLRDGNGAVAGSGTAWPPAQGTTVVPIARRPVIAARPPAPLDWAPARGARRVLLVILDCGDWRFLQHGRARGELPTFEALATRGERGVLTSQPPFTAVAVHSIAQPGDRGVAGLLGVLHQLGSEVAGLEFVRGNPAAPIAWVLPGSADLFATLGAGSLRVANLLHSHGALQVGAHGEVVGPHGARALLQLDAARPLTPDEAALFGPLEQQVQRELLGTIAADFDATDRLLRPGGPDVILLRVASLDLLTHQTFPKTAAAGQDDGNELLFHLYRYIDARLRRVQQELDGNDVLIVMSDHGAHTALQHDSRAIFLAAGAAVPAGRLPGQPDLRGIPRLLADLVGVRTDWPATGIVVPAPTPPLP